MERPRSSKRPVCDRIADARSIASRRSECCVPCSSENRRVSVPRVRVPSAPPVYPLETYFFQRSVPAGSARSAGACGYISEPRGPADKPIFGPFSAFLCTLSLTQMNHAHFGTDVESSIIQRFGGQPKGVEFEKPPLRRSEPESNRFEAIVIGSGMRGMTTSAATSSSARAALLPQTRPPPAEAAPPLSRASWCERGSDW
jgi:hypothetical protein